MATRTPSNTKRAAAVTREDLSHFGTRKPMPPVGDLFRAARPAPGVLPEGALAMDSAPGYSAMYQYAAAYGSDGYGYSGEGLEFLGYPVLSALAQRPEYRRIVGTRSQELTRKWGRLTSSGTEDKTAKLAEIDSDLTRFGVRDVLRLAADHDGFFGVGRIFIDLGNFSDFSELATPLPMSPTKVARDSLTGFRCVEPIWVYPTGSYDTVNPLSPDFYRPRQWYVSGNVIHRDRLLTVMSRPVPDMLKPVYQFGGLSLTQMAKPFVDEWIRSRRSVADLVEAFAVWVLSTDFNATQGGVGETLENRVALFNALRNTRGLMVLNKDSESLENIDTPLTGLDKLVAQCQERIAFPAGMPLVKAFGVTPTGLNATGEGEMDCWRDEVAANQEHMFNAPMRCILDVIQLSRYGFIDPAIGWTWNALKQINDVERVNIRKTEAETAEILIDKCVISPEDERKRLATEPNSAYANLDLNEVITPPDMGGEDDEMDGGDTDDTVDDTADSAD